MRLQKYMAYCGVASRRKCEEIIRSGCVKVNNEVVTHMGIKIDPDRDVVSVNGSRLRPKEEKVYILLNKPKGVITSVKDQYNRLTVIDCIGRIRHRIFPIGRLDYNTEGLLILTNDGRLTNLMTHPRYEVDKEYLVLAKGEPSKTDMEALSTGVDIGGYITKPALVNKVGTDNNKNTLLKVVIREGRNRQVRRMFDAINHSVLNLKRIRIANIKLGELKPGDWRYLSPDEVSLLYKSVLRGKSVSD